MDEEPDISINEIRLWTLSALMDFLLLRNLTVSQRKEELVALVFAAELHPHQHAPLATSPAEAAGEKATAYDDLLITPTGKLPDPKSLDNWVRNKE